MKSLQQIYMAQPNEAEVDIYRTFCKEVATIYAKFFEIMYDRMEPPTWYVVMSL